MEEEYIVPFVRFRSRLSDDTQAASREFPPRKKNFLGASIIAFFDDDQSVASVCVLFTLLYSHYS